MVTVSSDQQRHRIVAQPNRSASWQVNKRLATVLGLWSLLTAGGFAAIGAWVVLPFAGLEVTALTALLYYVCWKLQRRHVVTLDDRQLVIEKGVYAPRQTWRLPRHRTALSVERQQHPLDPLRLHLCSPRERIPIGDFLTVEESEQLLAALRAQGLTVRNDSHRTIQYF